MKHGLCTFLALAALLSTAAAQAAPECEIPGKAVHWMYDPCMARHETDDALHTGVSACVDRTRKLVRQQGECMARRILKERLCELTEGREGGRAGRERCMRDPAVMGPTVRNGGI